MAKVKYYELKDIKFVEKSSRVKDLKGQKFNKLLVLGYAGTDNGSNATWVCECECSKIVKKKGTILLKGRAFSCGCISKTGKTIERHGMVHTVEYKTYQRAKSRCQYKRNPSYERYGERGIKFLFTSFKEFFEDVGLRPSDLHSLDRINNNGNYEKGNVRWATIKEQCDNRNNSIFIEYKGETLSLPDWAEKLGIRRGLLHQRHARGVRDPELLFEKSKNRPKGCKVVDGEIILQENILSKEDHEV